MTRGAKEGGKKRQKLYGGPLLGKMKETVPVTLPEGVGDARDMAKFVAENSPYVLLCLAFFAALTR